MESKAKLLGHPIHPMLIAFPIGLLTTSVLFDLVGLLINRDNAGIWHINAYYMIAAGILGGLVAAIFGFVDWLGIPHKTRARNIGAIHGVGNVIMIALFAASWLLRRGTAAEPPPLAIVLSFAGILLATFTAWLGGEMVNRLAVGVDRGAHLDSPNSLSGRPASENAQRTTINPSGD